MGLETDALRFGKHAVRFVVFPTVALVALTALSACTGNASFPSPSISTVLTPEPQDKVAAQQAGETGTETASKEVAADDAATSSENPVLGLAGDNQAKLALAPTAPSSTPATEAVDQQATSGGSSTAALEDKKTDEQTEAEILSQQSQVAEPPKPEPKKQGGLLASLFQSNGTSKSERGTRDTAGAVRKKRSKVTVRRVASTGERGAGTRGLPGVRTKNIFGIDDDIETEEFDEPTQVASVASMARRGTHGLLLQRPDVKVGCFPRQLLHILKSVESRYRRAPIVTSGYRSVRYNRMVRGARNSTHTRCLAADIQVKGVSKWHLAKYLRSLPGRGGVGTYCHTKSVHIDIGKQRAWHHCRRSRGKKRRKRRS